jgi:hypothetical protein
LNQIRKLLAQRIKTLCRLVNLINRFHISPGDRFDAGNALVQLQSMSKPSTASRSKPAPPQTISHAGNLNTATIGVVP